MMLLFFGFKEGPPNGDFLTKEYAVRRLALLTHRATYAKHHFLSTGEMRHLAYWRTQEQVLYEFEKVVYATFSPRELQWYLYTESVKRRVQHTVRPFWVWWYTGTAERAYTRYVQTPTTELLQRWGEAEVRVTRAEGVVSMHFSFGDTKTAATDDVLKRKRAVANVLRQRRRGWVPVTDVS